MKWDGPAVLLSELSGSSELADISRRSRCRPADGTPRYHFDGKPSNIAYKGGELDLEGILDAEGQGSDLLESAHAEGTLRGRSILFAPDTEFRAVKARFEMQGGGAGSRWKLSNVEVNQSGESLAGTGASQADGKLVLELVNRGNHYATLERCLLWLHSSSYKVAQRRVEFVERRLDVTDPASRANDADPQQKRERSRQFWFRRHLAARSARGVVALPRNGPVAEPARRQL